MRISALSAAVMLLLGSSALGQSYEMTIHLASGQTVTIPHDDIRRIEFINVLTGTQDPAGASRPFRLLQNYPNPFNPSTTIEYEIPDAADVELRIFDLKGALIRELLHETQAAGRHQAIWDGMDSKGARVASGVYLYAVACGGSTLTQQLILVK